MRLTRETQQLVGEVVFPILFTVLGVSFLVWLGLHWRWYDPATGYALFALLSVTITGVVVWFTIERWTNTEIPRKRTQWAEASFRALAESAVDAIITTDARGHITYFNLGAERIFGYEAREMLGRSLTRLVPELMQEGQRTGFAKLLATGKLNVAAGAIELHGRHKDGSLIPLEPTLTSYQTADGTFFTAILRDITQRKQQAETLAQALADAHAATKSKADFLAYMSHELRTPLSAVIGFSELLEVESADILSGEQREYVHWIVKSGRHLLQIINDTLDLSKIDAGKQLLNLERFDLCLAAEEGVNLIRPLAIAKNQTLSIQCDPPTVWVTGDPGKIRQVITNLLANAVKFTPEMGQIDVKVVLLGDEVALSVTDNGPGIAPEDHPKVFLEFEQVDHVSTRDQKGTGLGMPLAYRLIHLHGGKLTLTSQLGQGATFTFTLHAPQRTPETR